MVDIADALVLAVLTRAPSSGGKSRLFSALGRRPDPDLLCALLMDTLNGAAAADVRQVVAVTPPSACAEVGLLVGPDVETMPQSEGDLGERMRATMAALFERGARAVVLIGSDIPHITAGHITEAFRAVVENPKTLVLGPAEDGGYYLIAARRVPNVFAGIDWGGADVLAQTERAASADGLRVQLLEQLTDVDSPDDLHHAAASGRAPSTAAWCARMLAPERPGVTAGPPPAGTRPTTT